MPINYLAEWFTNIDDVDDENAFGYLEEDMHDDMRAERDMDE